MEPTRETFGNIPLWSQALFYVLAIVSLGVFAAGLWRRFRLWRQGRPIDVAGLFRGGLQAVVGKTGPGIRRLLADDETDQTIHDRVFRTLRYLLRQRLAIGRPVHYIDATNLTPQERAPYVAIGQAYGCEVEAVFFDVPLEVCRERNARRHGCGANGFIGPVLMETGEHSSVVRWQSCLRILTRFLWLDAGQLRPDVVRGLLCLRVVSWPSP